jgi:hypothetical protein
VGDQGDDGRDVRENATTIVFHVAVDSGGLTGDDLLALPSEFKCVSLFATNGSTCITAADQSKAARDWDCKSCHATTRKTDALGFCARCTFILDNKPPREAVCGKCHVSGMCRITYSNPFNSSPTCQRCTDAPDRSVGTGCNGIADCKLMKLLCECLLMAKKVVVVLC